MSSSTVKLDINAAKETNIIVVRISLIVLGQSSRVSSVLPLPKLCSSH